MQHYAVDINGIEDKQPHQATVGVVYFLMKPYHARLPERPRSAGTIRHVQYDAAVAGKLIWRSLPPRLFCYWFIGMQAYTCCIIPRHRNL